MSSLDYLDLCRLCLVKDRVSVPIFDGEGDVRQIFLKIAACLPVKVAREDKLPKKICDDCVYKVELFYQFWNTTANAEKQLLQWLGEVNLEDKQGYVTDVLNTGAMKEDQSTENRLDGNVIQHVGEHQNNMGMGMMDNMGLGIPIIISSANQQQITSVPMDTSGSSVQTVQAVPGPSSQTTHNQISQNRTSSAQHEDEEDTDDEENSDEECDGDDGLTVKEESEEEPSNRTVEPTTFVNVPLACDEAGPSGLQQQKLSEIPEMPMPQSADEDPKSEGEPVAGQQRNRDRNSSYCLTTGSWKREDDEKRRSNFEHMKSDEFPLHNLDFNNSQNIRRYSKKSKIGSPKPKKGEPEVDQLLDKIKNTCPFCEKHFDNAKKVENHVTYVHRKPYKCDKCKRSCHTARSLEEHKLIHRPDYFFECETCHVKYKSEDSLKRHNMRTHSDHESKYVCEHCGRSYKLKIDLTHHMKRTHLQELQICRYCGKEVKDLKGHEWRHQRRNREVKYELTCHLCRKKFHHRSRLDNHLRRHEKGFKCKECGKEYREPRQLIRHKMFKHGQAKISTCILCQKEFSSSSNFYQHVLTHAGMRPYKCDICEEDFTQRSSLLRHRRHHAGPLPPLHSNHPQIAELARNYLKNLQNDQIDKSCVLNVKL